MSRFLRHLAEVDNLLPAAGLRWLDLRPSTPRIVRAAWRRSALPGRSRSLRRGADAGPVPSRLAEGMPSLMVTGSHIPEDRNGIKPPAAAASSEIRRGGCANSG
jgi:phosphomannomutase